MSYPKYGHADLTEHSQEKIAYADRLTIEYDPYAGCWNIYAWVGEVCEGLCCLGKPDPWFESADSALVNAQYLCPYLGDRIAVVDPGPTIDADIDCTILSEGGTYA